MARYPKIFDKFYQNIVKIGEESTLIYPAIILVMALIIALTVTFFILPKITNLFAFRN